MKLVEYDYEKLKNDYGYKKTSNLKIIEEFEASNLDCCRVESSTHKNARSLSSSLSNSIKRFGKHNIRVILSDGEVFLVKRSIENK